MVAVTLLLGLSEPYTQTTQATLKQVVFVFITLISFKVLVIQFLNECLNFEINIGGKVCNFLCLYRPLSQNRDTFKTFTDNLELTLDALTNNKLFLIVIIGDFNAKVTNQYKNDATSYTGLKIDAITFQFGLQQLIIEPTHLTGNSSLVIDLTFTSQ